jgi:hypothetical protein
MIAHPLITLSFLGCFAFARIGTIDRSTDVRVTRPWLETGYMTVDSGGWTVIQTIGRSFSSNAVVLTALPDIGGLQYYQGNSTATRLRNIVSNSSGVFFEVKVSLFILLCDFISSSTLSYINLMTYIAIKLHLVVS